MLDEQELTLMEEMKIIYDNFDNTMIKSGGKDAHTTPNMLKAFMGEMEVVLDHQQENFKVMMLQQEERYHQDSYET